LKLSRISQVKFVQNWEFTFSSSFWKWANSVPWESENTISITLPVDALFVTLNFIVKCELRRFLLHWITLWFGLVLMYIHDSSPVTILLSIGVSSPSSACTKKCCKDRLIRCIVSRSFSSLSDQRAQAFR
jgi:hypothetical protein